MICLSQTVNSYLNFITIHVLVWRPSNAEVASPPPGSYLILVGVSPLSVTLGACNVCKDQVGVSEC